MTLFTYPDVHKTYTGKLLISHPFGLPTDASKHFENLEKQRSILQSQFKFKAGGSSESSKITDDNCTKYLQDFRMEDDMNVVVPHLEHFDEQSLHYKITFSFVRKLLSRKGNSLFTSVNLFQYLKGFDVTGDNHLKDTSNTFILYPSGYAAVVIITLPEDETESLREIQRRANANAKAYLMLYQEMLTKESQKLIIINVIGAVHNKKLANNLSCNDCRYCNLVIYKEDLNDNLKSWWGKCSKMLKELSKNRNIDYDVKLMEGLASRSALHVGLTNDAFPSLFSSEDERICKIALNAAQREILLFNVHPRKIIIGKILKSFTIL